MIADQNPEKSIDLLFDLMQDVPPGVDLTLIGGAALVFYVNIYQDLYPENFEGLGTAGTKDLDFICIKEDAIKCQEHWGGNLIVPEPDNHTPEVAILCIERGGETVQIDFMEGLAGVNPAERALRGRELLVEKGGGALYSINEYMVLLNRVMNVMALRKTDRTTLQQLKQAMAVVKSAIQGLLDEGQPKLAARQAGEILKLAKAGSSGMNLFQQHGIDLIQVVPEDERYPREFKEFVLSSLVRDIRGRRAGIMARTQKQANKT